MKERQSELQALLDEAIALMNDHLACPHCSCEEGESPCLNCDSEGWLERAKEHGPRLWILQEGCEYIYGQIEGMTCWHTNKLEEAPAPGCDCLVCASSRFVDRCSKRIGFKL